MAPKRKAEDAPAVTLSTYPQLFGTPRKDAGDMALETIHETDVARTAELQTRIKSIQAKIDEVKPALDDAVGSEQSEAMETLLGISKEVADLLAELCEQSMEMSDVSESFNGVIAELDNLSLSTTSMLEAQATARESYAASKTAEVSAERMKQTAESFSIAERAMNKHMNSTDTSVRDRVARYQKAQRDFKNLLPQKADELSQALFNMAKINENLRPLRQATEVMRGMEQLKIRAGTKDKDADEDDESEKGEIEEDSEDDGLEVADEFERELYAESDFTRMIKDSLSGR
jgi:hypothetical protein